LLLRRGSNLSKEDAIQMEGVVEDISSNAFKVKLTNGMDIRATLAGKLRIHHIRILPGDKVKVEISPYDLTNGRIVYRNK
jgi:translation initiation factor IF-1